jgi:hypothetical protein
MWVRIAIVLIAGLTLAAAGPANRADLKVLPDQYWCTKASGLRVTVLRPAGIPAPSFSWQRVGAKGWAPTGAVEDPFATKERVWVGLVTPPKLKPRENSAWYFIGAIVAGGPGQPSHLGICDGQVTVKRQ